MFPVCNRLTDRSLETNGASRTVYVRVVRFCVYEKKREGEERERMRERPLIYSNFSLTNR